MSQFGSWKDERWEWDWSLFVDHLGSDRTAMEELKSILTNKDKDDIWIWGLDTNKLFTVESCYYWLAIFFPGENLLVVFFTTGQLVEK